MRKLLCSLSILMCASFALAADPAVVKETLEAQPVCQNFVRFDDQNLYLGFGAYRRGFEEPRQPIPASILVAPLAQPGSVAFPLMTLDAAIDAVAHEGRLYVLTYSGLEEWDLANRKRVAVHATHNRASPLAYKEHAQAFARVGETLIIAHGRWGVSFFDLKTKQVTKMLRLIPAQSPLESMATGVTVNGSTAYVVMDNFSLVRNGKPAFRGIVQIDMGQQRVVREMDGLDPFATSVTTNGRDLIVGFGGDILWIYDLAKLNGNELPQPRRRVWEFERKGHPVGSGVLDGRYYHTCYMNEAPTGRGRTLSPASLEL